MSKLCDGIDEHHQKILKNSKAYCEGVEAAFAGGAVTLNPEDGVGSEGESAWDAGHADALAGTVSGCSCRRGQQYTP
jgi:hypothetical protein